MFTGHLDVPFVTVHTCELFSSLDFFLLGGLFLIDWWKFFWIQALCSVTGFYKCLGPGLFFHFIWLHGLTSSSSLLLWGSPSRSKPKGKGFTRLPVSLQTLGTNPHCISPQRPPSLLVSQLLPWNLHVLSGAPSLGLTSLGCCSPRIDLCFSLAPRNLTVPLASLRWGVFVSLRKDTE